ncbi:MAG TPA: BlaI/MecI/CopY family transcriptional regulator [Thermoanaerobaculia bacterium]|nr:BlaI/MecI/CopY family transcriptional regulator [Thermoanaerobaculia bacterium]
MRRMSKPEMSRRERQILDVLLEVGEAPAEDIRQRLPDPPSYSAVRVMLTRLEKKGYVSHREEGVRYVYSPAVSKTRERRNALSRLVRTFFGGSTTEAVTALLDGAEDLSREELDRLAGVIEKAKETRKEEEP